MVWALVLVVVIGAGLPVGAWAVTRKLPPPRRWNSLGVGFDSIDKWLLARYQLAPHDRWRVREAVLKGRAVNDGRLADAVHGLADDLLTRRPWPVRLAAILPWTMLLLAAGFAVEGIVWFTVRPAWEGQAQGIVGFIESGVFVAAGILMLYGSRRLPRNLSTALQANTGRDTKLDTK